LAPVHTCIFPYYTILPAKVRLFSEICKYLCLKIFFCMQKVAEVAKTIGVNLVTDRLTDFVIIPRAEEGFRSLILHPKTHQNILETQFSQRPNNSCYVGQSRIRENQPVTPQPNGTWVVL